MLRVFSLFRSYYLHFYFTRLLSTDIAVTLDENAEEINKKIKEVILLQKTALNETQKTLNNLQKTQKNLIPLVLYLLYIVEMREEYIENMQAKLVRNSL